MFLLVEYCRYGNLLSYVINARGRFVNEVDSVGNLSTSNQQNEEEITAGDANGENYISIENA